jgi:hypothetical protein
MAEFWAVWIAAVIVWIGLFVWYRHSGKKQRSNHEEWDDALIFGRRRNP